MDRIKHITTKDIRRFLSESFSYSSQATIDRKLSSFNKFFTWLKSKGDIAVNPIEDLIKTQKITLPNQNLIQAKLNEPAIINQSPLNHIQRLINARYADNTRVRKILEKILFTRPKWYQTYHSLSFTKYLHIAILMIFVSALGYGIYDQFFAKTRTPAAYPSTLTRPNRYLSFQGRLTNQYNTPITSSTTVRFQLYDSAGTGSPPTGGTLLWDSNNCTVDPDQDGIFNVLLGTTSGDGFTCSTASEITSDVFSENAAVWLHLTTGGESMDPRIQIATVAYALNAETLQGFPAGTGTSTIPYIDSTGTIAIAAASPKIDSSSGTFAIEGQALTIQTGSGTNGDIAIAPDGTGSVNITSNTQSDDSVYIQNAQTTTGSLLHIDYTGGGTTQKLLKVGVGTTASDKFWVTSGGVTYVSDALGIGVTAPTQELHVNGDMRLTGFLYDYNNESGSLNQILSRGASGVDWIDSNLASAGGWTDDGSIVRLYSSTDKVGIGTTIPATTLGVVGGVGIGATNTGGFANAAIANYNLALEGSLGIGVTAPTQSLHTTGSIRVEDAYYDTSNSAGSSGYYLQSTGTGTSWTNLSTVLLPSGTQGQTLYYNSGWTATSNLFNDGTNVGIGTTVPTKGKLNVLGSVAIGSTAYTEPSGAAPSNGLIVEGNVGVGITSPQASLDIKSGNSYVQALPSTGLQRLLVYDTRSTLSGNDYGAAISSRYTGGTSAQTLISLASNAAYEGSGTLGNLESLRLQLDAASSGNVTTAYGINNSVTALVGDIGTAYGIYSNVGEFMGNITTGYAGYFMATGAARNYGIYSAAGENYFNDNVGIGTTVPSTKLGVVGGVGIGTTTSFANAAIAANNLAVQGSLGVGTTSPYSSASTIGVTGGIAIGGTGTYANKQTPTGGLIVEGNVGIGTTSPRVGFDLVNSQNTPFILQKSGSTGFSISSYWPTLAMNMYHNGSNWVALGDGYTSSWNQDPTSGLMSFSLYGSSVSAGQNLGAYTGYQRLVVTNSGNIGIGTTSPGTRLGIAGGVGIGTTDSYANAAIAANNLAVQGSLGVGTTSPTTLLQLGFPGTTAGTLSLAGGTSGLITIDTLAAAGTWSFTLPPDDGDANEVLVTDGSGNATWEPVSSVGTGGTGTANYVTKWFDVDTLTNSVLFDNGTNVGIGTTAPGTKLGIVGGVGIGTTDSFANAAIAANNLAVQGSIGVGTTSPYSSASTIGVTGGVAIGATGTYANKQTPTGGLIVEGNVGVGTTSPGDKLDVVGEIDTSTYYKLGNNKILDMENTDTLLVGVGAGNSISAGSIGDTYVGYNSGFTSNGNATYNTAVGYQALYSVTNGDTNIAIGAWAGDSITDGSDNTIIGTNAADDLISGSGNLVAGYNAGNVMTGDYNVVLGSVSGVNLSTGDFNTFLGESSGTGVSTGTNNTLLGWFTQSSAGSNSYSIALGSNARITANNQWVVGDDTANTFISDAYFGVGVSSTTPVDITFNASGGSGTDITGSNFILAGGKATGNADSGDLIFKTGAVGVSGTVPQTLTERVRLLDEGYLGIGTSAPGNLLQIGTPGTTAGTLSLAGGTSGLITIDTLAAAGTWSFTLPPDDGDANEVLVTDGSGNATWEPVSSVGTGGTGTANYVTKWFDVDTLTNSVLYDTGTNIGLGTTSPQTKLGVVGGVGIGTTASFANAAVAANNLAVQGSIGVGTTSPYSSASTIGVTGGVAIGATGTYANKQTPTGGLIVEGNVGVGTTSPTYKLNVETSTTNGVYISRTSSGTNVKALTINLSDNDNSDLAIDVTGSPTFVVTGLGRVGIGTSTPNNLLDVYGANSSIRLETQENTEITNSNASYIYTTYDTGSAYPFTSIGNLIIQPNTNASRDIILMTGSTSPSSRVVITGGGLVGVGTTAPSQELTIYNDTVIGGSTSLTETLANTGFSLGGDDLFVAGTAGIEGSVYTDGSFIAGASTTYGNGSITQSASETFGINTTSAALSLTTTTSGDINLTSAGEINFNDATTGTIPFAADDAALNASLTNAIVDAINETYTAAIGGGGGVWTRTNPYVYLTTSGDQVGIGTTSPQAKLGIVGGVGIGTTASFANAAVAANNLAVQGSIGVGTTSPYSSASTIGVTGGVAIGATGTYANKQTPTGGLIVEGNTGIGTTSPSQKLDVQGNIALLGASSSDDDYLYFDTGTSESIMWDDSPGQFVISDDILTNNHMGAGSSGSISSNKVLNLYETFTDSTTSSFGAYIDARYNFTATGNHWNPSGLFVSTLPTVIDNGFSVSYSGIQNDLTLQSSSTVDDTIGILSTLTNNSGSTSYYLRGFQTGAVNNGDVTSSMWGGYIYANNSVNDTAVQITGLYTSVTNAATLDAGNDQVVYSGSYTEASGATDRSVALAKLSLSNSGTITTTYGLLLQNLFSGTQTNVYGIWGDAGDWIIDEDGNGTAGGSSGGGDIVLGEGQDLEFYHDGTNSYIVNNTGDLYITDTGTDDVILSSNGGLVGIGTTSPGTKLGIVGGVGIGTTASFANAAVAANNLAVQGSIGVGTTSPYSSASTIGVTGGVAIGATGTYANKQTPTGGLIVEGNVGIGITAPTRLLDVFGSMRLDGQLYDENNSVGTPGQILSTTASGTDWIDTPASGVSGSGTDNYVPRWNGTTGLENSIIYDTTTNIGIGTTAPGTKLGVVGGVGIGTTDSFANAAIAANNLAVQGSVGIGLTAPTTPLHISSTASTTNVATITANSLTTGFAMTIPHTTSVIANGGSLMNLSSTSVDTSTTTGALLNLSSTASTAGTQFLQTYSGLLTGIGQSIVSDSLTSGSALSISSSSTALTGDLAIITASGSNAAVTGNALKVGLTGASATGTALNITTAGASGYALRVNDNGTYTDSDPFVIDTSGYVGIGTTSPGTSLHVKLGSTSHALGAGDAMFNGAIEANGPIYLDDGIYDTNGTLTISVDSDEDTTFAGDILVTGNAGIGTTTPGTKLGVVGGVGIGTTDSFANAAIAANNLAVQGSVGIGLTAPTSQLHLYSTSTTTSFTGFNLNWSPSSTTTLTGDLFTIGIGTTLGNVANIFNIKDSGTYLFSVSETLITSAIPHQFTAAGDVSFAYDAVFTNQTASEIESYGPFTIRAGETWENNNLTLKTYGTGDLIAEVGGNLKITSADAALVFDSLTATDTDYWMGVTEDAGGDDDDVLQIGDGTTTGSNVFLTINTSGNIGIGTTSPGTKLGIVGGVGIGTTASFANAAIAANNLAVQGSLGVGTTSPYSSASTIGVTGGIAIGATGTYANKQTPTGGLIVEGNTGIGTTSPGTKLGIVGGVGIGTTDSFANAAIAANNLAVQGNVGVGLSNPSEELEISGSDAVFRTTGSSLVRYTSVESDASSNEKIWDMMFNAGQLVWRTTDDSYTNPTNFFMVNRTGYTIDAVNLPNGSIAIGTESAPRAKLDIVSADSTIILPDYAANTSCTRTYDGELCLGETAGGVARIFAQIDGTDIYWTNDGAGDFSEYFEKNLESEYFKYGSIVSSGQNGVTASSTPYDNKLIGVVSLFGTRNNDIDGSRETDNRYVNTALVGQVPVIVKLDREILSGDPITSSTDVGIAQKSILPGKIVGFSLDMVSQSKPVGKLAQNYWDQLNAKLPDTHGFETFIYNQNIKDFEDAVANGFGIIMVNVTPSWHDPNIRLTNTGEINIEKIAELNKFKATYATNNSVAENIGVFSEAVIANLKTGVLESIEVISENIVAGDGIFNNIKTGLIEAGNITSEGVIAFQIQVDNLLVKTGLVSPSIQTAMLSPLANESDIDIILGSKENNTEGKLTIKNSDGTEVASINSQGDISARDATFSGELTSDSLATNELVNKTSNNKISLDKIEELLNKAESDQNILSQVQNWNINTASDSATLKDLALENLYVTGSAAMNTLSLSTSLSIGSDFVIQSEVNPEGSRRTTINSLSTPLEIQSIAMMPVEIMAGLFRIDTNGDVSINGNLDVAGRIKSQGLTLKDKGNTSDNLLSIQDSKENEVAAITASGSAQLKEVETGRLVIADAQAYAQIANSLGEIESNSTAGQAVLSAGNSEVTIKNPNITNYTLVYITPTTTTQNKVLFIKSKDNGYFTVGFDEALDQDVEFNWWIIEVSN